MSENKEKQPILDKLPFLKKIKNIKHIEIILVCIFAIILVVIFSSTKNNKSSDITNLSSSEFSAENYSQYLEKKLANILGEVSGAGKVSVMITLDGGMKYEYATEREEITTSTDVGGGTNSKTTINEEVVIITVNGKSTPLIIKESYPNIIGVVIVASGASNAQVKLNIMRATTTLLEVVEDKVEILSGTI